MEEPRYRVEAGEAIIEVRVATIEQLFDNRDPAPFRKRDLDPDLVEYLIAAAHDVARADRLRLQFWIEEPCPAGAVEDGVRSHVGYELERANRRRREQVRVGWVGLTIATVAIIALVGLAQLVGGAVAGPVGAGLREALLISGWVLMWRPVELLVHDGIPWRRERRALRALRDAAIEVRAP